MGVEDKKVPSREILQGKLRALVAQMSAPIDRFGVVGILEENAKKVCPQPSVRRARTLLIINDFDLTGKILQPGLAMSSPRADAGRISSDPSMAEAAGVDEYLIVPGTGHWPDSMIKYRLDLTLSVPDGKSGVVDQVVEIETSRHAFSFDFSGNDFRPVSLTLRQRNLVSRFQWQTSRMLNYQEETVDKRVVTELTSGFAHGILSGRDVVNQTVARTEKPAQVSTPVRPSSPNETPRITPVYKAPEASSGRKEGNEMGEKHMKEAAIHAVVLLKLRIEIFRIQEMLERVMREDFSNTHDISWGRPRLFSHHHDAAYEEAKAWLSQHSLEQGEEVRERLRAAFIGKLSKLGIDYAVVEDGEKHTAMKWFGSWKKKLRYSVDLVLSPKREEEKRKIVTVSTYIRNHPEGKPTPILSMSTEDEVCLGFGNSTNHEGEETVEEMVSIYQHEIKIEGGQVFSQLVDRRFLEIINIYSSYLSHCLRRGFEPYVVWALGPAPMMPPPGHVSGIERIMQMGRDRDEQDIRKYLVGRGPMPSSWIETNGPPSSWIETHGDPDEYVKRHPPFEGL